ncbi:hypothetical protein LWI28_028737 [Acer negundo]|uniref:Uncharacterized protein n=1 Tax=Acer negundo TaxID=4023 RepID=A0AAD5JWA5_ACENE|nr:hypothetical protein LWI28_028737 [Acer negundo]
MAGITVGSSGNESGRALSGGAEAYIEHLPIQTSSLGLQFDEGEDKGADVGAEPQFNEEDGVIDIEVELQFDEEDGGANIGAEPIFDEDKVV